MLVHCGALASNDRFFFWGLCVWCSASESVRIWLFVSWKRMFRGEDNEGQRMSF